MADPPLKKKRFTKSPGANLGAGHVPSTSSSSTHSSENAPPPAPEPSRSGRVLRSHFGIHTIESDHLTHVVANIAAGRDYVKRSFFDLGNYLIRRQDVRITYQPQSHGVVLQSQIARPAATGGVAVYPPVSLVVGGYEPHMKLTVRHSIVFKLPYIEGALAEDALGTYLPGGQPDDKKLTAALYPALGNLNLTRMVSPLINGSMYRYENKWLYAKGLFYCMLQERCNQENIPLIYPAFPLPLQVNYEDTSPPAANPAIIADPLQRGDFALFLNLDFKMTDLQFVYWLSASGRRLAPAAGPSIAALAIHWPSIPFVIYHQAGPALPPPILGPINPTTFWNWLHDFATVRNERDQLIAGAYEASLLVNSVLQRVTDGVPPPANLAPRPDTNVQGLLLPIRCLAQIPPEAALLEWHALMTPTFETFGETLVPMPHENNFLQRLLGITRAEDSAYLTDLTSLGQTSMAERLTQAATFAGFVSIFTTTVLQSFNCYGTILQRWATNHPAPAPDLFNMLANTFRLFTNVDNKPATMSIIFMQAFTMLDRHIGGVPPPTVFAYRSWNLVERDWDLPGPFILNSPNHAPRLGNPLSILSWLDLIPSEWGVVDSTATVDFTKEVAIQGVPNVAGWYATNGERLYIQKRIDPNPYTLIPYGALALNSISLGIRNALPPGPLPALYQQYPWDLIGVSPPTAIGPHPQPPIWMPAHFIFEPCTINTFEWDLGVLLAPVLTSAAVGPVVLLLLHSSNVFPSLGRGYLLVQKVPTNAPSLTFVPPGGCTVAVLPQTHVTAKPGDIVPPPIAVQTDKPVDNSRAQLDGLSAPN
ncbi:Parp [Bemisia tabaci toti-like virus 1]|uniref:Parp n=1 Tax=Bemisia tabaci toti-like virus 1 TaxID=2838153 RepID=A0A8E6Y768_9VIRU|nr:Parp [Bemisia tabaci toti-like virus 1]